MEPLKIMETRVLRPYEFDKIRNGIIRKQADSRATLDFLLLTGMRYIEAVRFWINDNSKTGDKWFMPLSNAIHLPKQAVEKQKRKQLARYVRLNREGVKAVETFLGSSKPPTIQNWRNNLIRWASKASLDTNGLGVKTTRKTWECWLMVGYPGRYSEICQTQGHTLGVSMEHYTGVPFNQTEINEIKNRVIGVF